MSKEADEWRLQNKREAARYLGVSVGTVERMMRDGLPYIKLTAAGAVRFRLADLVAFAEERVQRIGGQAEASER